MAGLRFRTDLSKISPYRPGRPIGEVAAAFGLTDITKLASNENPDPPFPEVIDAVTAAASEANRYPDNAKPQLRAALSDHLDVDPSYIWMGGASNELTLITALTMGGPETTSVFGWPSFSLYRIGTLASHATPIEIPLDRGHRHDLPAMANAITDSTSIVYVCNPNNPTGTHVSHDHLVRFVDSAPSDVLVVIDEAYHEYATAPDHASAIDLAVARPNVMITRTFSKVYGLAGLRVGYAVTAPSTIAQLQRIQLPFSVNSVAEAAASEALLHQDRVAARVSANAIGREYLTQELRGRGIGVPESQANFVYADLGPAAPETSERLLERGVIVRPIDPTHVRITVGTQAENERFLETLDTI